MNRYPAFRHVCALLLIASIVVLMWVANMTIGGPDGFACMSVLFFTYGLIAIACYIELTKGEQPRLR